MNKKVKVMFMKKILAKVLVATMVISSILTGPTSVEAKAKAKVKMSSKSITLVVGKTKTIKLKSAKASKVKWSTSNKKIATVSKGKIKAKKKGTCKVYAKYNGKKYTCKVTVKAKKVVTTTTTEATTEKQQEATTETTKKPNKENTKTYTTTEEPNKPATPSITEATTETESSGVYDSDKCLEAISQYEGIETPSDWINAACYWYRLHSYEEYTCWACYGVAKIMVDKGYKAIIIQPDYDVSDINHFLYVPENENHPRELLHKAALIFTDETHYHMVEVSGIPGLKSADSKDSESTGFTIPWRPIRENMYLDYAEYCEFYGLTPTEEESKRNTIYCLTKDPDPESIDDEVDWLRDYKTVRELLNAEYSSGIPNPFE